MNDKYIPINKGNYSMDTAEREERFEQYRGEGWEEEYSEYRNNWSKYAESQIVSEYPLLVDIELSSLCNLKCPMCYTISDEFKKKVNTKRMDWELYKKIIDEINGKVPAIRLSLRGEATLHMKFVDCIRYAKDNGIKEVSTLTHAGKMTPGYFEKIVDAGIDWITVSVDGLGDVYEEVRKPLKFDDLLSKLESMRRIKEEKGVNRPVIKVQGIWPAIRANPGEYYDTFKPISDLVAFNPLIDYLGNDTSIQYIDGFSCPQQYQRLVVGADGQVMKCSNDEENAEVIGDLTEESVYQIWHGKALQAVRDMHKTPCGFMQSEVCRKCYLPRKTTEEKTSIGSRTVIVKNYLERSQIIGQ